MVAVFNAVSYSSFVKLKISSWWHDGLFCLILLHLDITLEITQKYDQVESYNWYVGGVGIALFL